MKVKRGQIWQSCLGGQSLKIIKRASGNRHWLAKKLGSNKTHMIHEGTLDKFYALIEKKE